MGSAKLFAALCVVVEKQGGVVGKAPNSCFFALVVYINFNFLGHGTRFETMAILVKALKCATKRLRAFP